MKPLRPFFCLLIVLALSACATSTPVRQTPGGTVALLPAPGTVSISGDDLKRTGRTDLSDALRASSPMFH